VEHAPVPEHPAWAVACSESTSTVAYEPHDPPAPPPEQFAHASPCWPPTVFDASAWLEKDAEQFAAPEHPAAAFANPFPAWACAHTDSPPPPGPLPPPDPLAEARAQLRCVPSSYDADAAAVAE
jgi:hypothetical protein